MISSLVPKLLSLATGLMLLASVDAQAQFINGTATLRTFNTLTNRSLWITIYDVGKTRHLDYGCVSPNEKREWRSGSYLYGSFYYVRAEIMENHACGGNRLGDTTIRVNPQSPGPVIPGGSGWSITSGENVWLAPRYYWATSPRDPGPDYVQSGEAYLVTSMAAEDDSGLFVISNNRFFKRGNIGPGTGNDWTDLAPAPDVKGMAILDEEIFIISAGRLLKRSIHSLDKGEWQDAGDAVGAIALATHEKSLYMVANNHIYWRLGVFPDNTNNWSEAGEAYGVTAMTSHNGSLYVLSNNRLWRRGQLGWGTGNDWQDAGDATGGKTLSSFKGGLYMTTDKNILLLGNGG